MRDFYVTSIEAVRLVRPTMPIIVHDSFRGPMWATLLKNFPFENIVMVRGIITREEAWKGRDQGGEEGAGGGVALLARRMCYAGGSFTNL